MRKAPACPRAHIGVRGFLASFECHLPFLVGLKVEVVGLLAEDHGLPRFQQVVAIGADVTAGPRLGLPVWSYLFFDLRLITGLRLLGLPAGVLGLSRFRFT